MPGPSEKTTNSNSWFLERKIGSFSVWLCNIIVYVSNFTLVRLKVKIPQFLVSLVYSVQLVLRSNIVHILSPLCMSRLPGSFWGGVPVLMCGEEQNVRTPKQDSRVQVQVQVPVAKYQHYLPGKFEWIGRWCWGELTMVLITRELPTNNPPRIYLPNMVCRVLVKCPQPGELQ